MSSMIEQVGKREGAEMQPMGMPEEMPTEMLPGMNLDPNVLIQTQNNFIANARIQEVKMEAAIAQLMMENQQLRALLDAPTESVGEIEERVRELIPEKETDEEE